MVTGGESKWDPPSAISRQRAAAVRKFRTSLDEQLVGTELQGAVRTSPMARCDWQGVAVERGIIGGPLGLGF